MLQFHLFMTHNVQYIPVVIPGSDADGSAVLKFLNMVLCGSVFLTTAVFARKVTVSTQLAVVDLVKNITGTVDTSMTQVLPQQSTERKDSEHEQDDEETIELTKAVAKV